MNKELQLQFQNQISKIEYKAEVKSESDRKSILLHGPVAMGSSDTDDGYINPTTLSKLLADCGGQDIDVHVNTYGGDVFGGIACYNTLKAYEGDVNIIVDGLGASAGSLIALAGNTVKMYKSSQLMVHNAWTFAMGNKHDLRKTLNSLEKIETSMLAIYMTKFNESEEKLQNLLDEETFLTADECLAYGLIDEIIEDEKQEDTEDKTEASVVSVYSNFMFKNMNAKKISNEPTPEPTSEPGVLKWAKFKNKKEK